MKYPNPTHSHAYCPICATRCVIPIERKGQVTYCRRHRASRENPGIPRTEFAGSTTSEIGVYKIYHDPDESWSPGTELARGELERMAKLEQVHPDSRWIHGNTIYGFYKRVLVPLERITA